jgi:hypothetical protein
MIIAAGAGALLLICILAYCCCKSSNQNKVEIIENNRVVDTSPREIELGEQYGSKPGVGNDTSVELEDVDDDELGEHGENSGDENQNNVYDGKKGYSGSKEKNNDD